MNEAGIMLTIFLLLVILILLCIALLIEVNGASIKLSEIRNALLKPYNKEKKLKKAKKLLSKKEAKNGK